MTTQSRFESLSPDARGLLETAHQAALDAGHNFVGQEHLLLAFAATPDFTGTRVLTNLGCGPALFSAELEEVLSSYPRETSSATRLGITARAARAIDLAFEQAESLNQEQVGTEHVLLGLMAEGEGVGAKFLLSKVALEAARAEVLRLTKSS